MNFIYRYHQPIHTGVTISTELIPQIYGNHFSLDVKYCILGDPGATSRDNAIFSGESLLQELKSHWELILNEPVPEVVEFRLLIGQKNIFLLNQQGRLAG